MFAKNLRVNLPALPGHGCTDPAAILEGTPNKVLEQERERLSPVIWKLDRAGMQNVFHVSKQLQLLQQAGCYDRRFGNLFLLHATGPRDACKREEKTFPPPPPFCFLLFCFSQMLDNMMTRLPWDAAVLDMDFVIPLSWPINLFNSRSILLLLAFLSHLFYYAQAGAIHYFQDFMT